MKTATEHITSGKEAAARTGLVGDEEGFVAVYGETVDLEEFAKGEAFSISDFELVSD